MASRQKAIRAKCLDCCCGNSAEVRRCPVEKCALWPFRMGRVQREDGIEETEETAENAQDAD